MGKRIGIYGGTFDPVHIGHLLLAECSREQCRLDEVWFMPTNVPPHKQDSQITLGSLRAEMLEFAIAGLREFKTDRRELRREGASYTVETLREVRREYPEEEFFFLMGGDSFHDFPQWREPEEILRLAQLVVCNRGLEVEPSGEVVRERFGAESLARVHFVRMPAIGIASREIRRKVSRGESIRFLTPRAVEQVIAHQGLYRIDQDQ